MDLPGGGDLTIVRPYTAANPLRLGTAVRSTATTGYDATADFDKVTISDTRPSNPGWSAQLQRADFTHATDASAKISAERSGFVNLVPQYLPGNALTHIDVQDIAAGTPNVGPLTFAKAAEGQGRGSVDVKGQYVLREVPTSLPLGTYSSTITFTVM